MKEIIVTQNEAGQRLDKLLLKYLNEASKSFVYKMLRKKNITLNGKKALGNEQLVVTDVVRLYLADETISKFSKHQLIQTNVKINIIYEDCDLILINKPSGMLSQKALPTDESLVEHLITYLLQSNQLTEKELESFRPSICNRLDRNTSGLVVAGKSLLGLQVMTAMFKARTINKYYRCIVSGEVKEKQFITSYLVKNEKTNKVGISNIEIANSQKIETEYEPLYSDGSLTLLEVHLITGKTHQIRAHLAASGYPIIGDYKYGKETINEYYKREYGIKHQILHAYRLEFPAIMEQLKHLENKEFVVSMPEIFKNIFPAYQER